jgi:hypothetical protein
MEGSLKHKSIKATYKVKELESANGNQTFNPHVAIQVIGLEKLGNDYKVHIKNKKDKDILVFKKGDSEK